MYILNFDDKEFQGFPKIRVNSEPFFASKISSHTVIRRPHQIILLGDGWLELSSASESSLTSAESRSDDFDRSLPV